MENRGLSTVFPNKANQSWLRPLQFSFLAQSEATSLCLASITARYGQERRALCGFYSRYKSCSPSIPSRVLFKRAHLLRSKGLRREWASLHVGERMYAFQGSAPHYLAARCDYLFDDDAVGEDEDLSDRGEEKTGSLHHPRSVTEHRDTSVWLRLHGWSHVSQLGYGITCERWEEGTLRSKTDNL